METAVCRRGIESSAKPQLSSPLIYHKEDWYIILSYFCLLLSNHRESIFDIPHLVLSFGLCTRISCFWLCVKWYRDTAVCPISSWLHLHAWLRQRVHKEYRGNGALECVWVVGTGKRWHQWFIWRDSLSKGTHSFISQDCDLDWVSLLLLSFLISWWSNLTRRNCVAIKHFSKN